MRLKSDQITIAITVYGRRRYLKQAIASALEQTVPVRVLVVEDCGPDLTLQAFVRQAFGDRVTYFRNPRRRGLFGNWNACLDYCRTPWLSILHDDDYLAPRFVEAMLGLGAQVSESALYFGNTTLVNEAGAPFSDWQTPQLQAPWRRVTLEDMLFITAFPFPGQLFRVVEARAVGGFRESSVYCGDWEMWARLTARSGAAQAGVTVAFNRQHQGLDRGTSGVVRSGKQYPSSLVQHKRILALLRAQGRQIAFDRRPYLSRFPIPTRYLVRFGANLPSRLLSYHTRLLEQSPSPNWRHWLFKQCARTFGPGFVRAVSRLASRLRPGPPQ